MALLTDDQDIRDVRMYMEHGGNGDYYLTLVERRKMSHSSISNSINMRIATSGGNAPTEVMLAAANLFRAMQAAGLNKHPRDDD